MKTRHQVNKIQQNQRTENLKVEYLLEIGDRVSATITHANEVVRARPRHVLFLHYLIWLYKNVNLSEIFLVLTMLIGHSLMEAPSEALFPNKSASSVRARPRWVSGILEPRRVILGHVDAVVGASFRSATKWVELSWGQNRAELSSLCEPVRDVIGPWGRSLYIGVSVVVRSKWKMRTCPHSVGQSL